MNHILEEFTREAIKHDLAKLSIANHYIFKRMYSYKNPDCDINVVVDRMAVHELNLALQQVRNSLKKLDN